MAGKCTVAVDLRAVNLGVKAIEVHVGTRVSYLFEPGHVLFDELHDMGRLTRPLGFRLDAKPVPRHAVFTAAVETLSVELLSHVSADHMPSLVSADVVSDSPGRATQWSTAALSPGSSRGSMAPLPGRFAVFDVVYHFRILECEADDTDAEMIARALSLSPRLHRAVGFRLHQQVQGLPAPQFVLHTTEPGNCVVPVQHSVTPVVICTVEIFLGSTAFQVAYHASEACATLKTAHYQIARRTAFLYMGQFKFEPHESNCVTRHAAVLLQGHQQNFRTTIRRRIEAPSADVQSHSNLVRSRLIRIRQRASKVLLLFCAPGNAITSCLQAHVHLACRG